MCARLENQRFTGFKPFLTSGPLHMLSLSLPGILSSDFILIVTANPKFSGLGKTSLIQ